MPDLSHKLSANQFGEHHRFLTMGLRRLNRAKRLFLKSEQISSTSFLPPELVEEIFYHTIEPFSSDDTHHLIRLPGDLPWAISQVCRQWRDVALAMPILWSHLPTVNLNSPKFIRSPKRCIALWSEILRRSKRSLITFQLCCEFDDDRTKPVLDLLVLHSERWQNISLDMPISTLKALEGARHRLPALRTLCWKGPEDEGVCEVFSAAPQLRNVNISDALLHHSVLILPDLGRVNHKQRGGNVDEIMRAIKCSYSSLQSLDFDRVVFEIYHRLESVITLPHLSALKIGNVKSELNFPRSLLNYLCIPVLEELRVKAEHTFMLFSINNLISRSLSPGGSSSLTKLYVRACFDPGELTELLHLTPLLTHLNVTWPHFYDMFALAHGKGKTWTLTPYLQFCAFALIGDIDQYPIQKFFEFAASRCGPRCGSTEDSSHIQSTRTRLRGLYITGPNLYPGAVDSTLTEEILKHFEWAYDDRALVYVSPKRHVTMVGVELDPLDLQWPYTDRWSE